jgi:hypothetical protein
MSVTRPKTKARDTANEDTRLLKRVVLEYFEAVNVKNAEEIAAFLRGNKQLVQLGKQPDEAPVVKSFGKCVSTVIALRLLQRLDRRLVHYHNSSVTEALLQGYSVDAKKPATRIESILVGHCARIAITPQNVAEMHDGDDQLKQLLAFGGGHVDGD